jgi:hypothetical protein
VRTIFPFSAPDERHLLRRAASELQTIEKGHRFAIEKLDVGGIAPASRGISRHGSRRDRHHAHVLDRLGGGLRLKLRIEQVLRPVRINVFALIDVSAFSVSPLKPGVRPNIVLLISPGLVDPVVGIECLQRGVPASSSTAGHPYQS